MAAEIMKSLEQQKDSSIADVKNKAELFTKDGKGNEVGKDVSKNFTEWKKQQEQKENKEKDNITNKLIFPKLITQPEGKIKPLNEIINENPDYLPEERFINAGIELITDKMISGGGISIPKENITILGEKQSSKQELQEVIRGIFTGDKQVRKESVMRFQTIAVDFYPGKKTSGDGSFGPNTLYAMMNITGIMPKDWKEGDLKKNDKFNITMNKILADVNSKRQADKPFSRNK